VLHALEVARTGKPNARPASFHSRYLRFLAHVRHLD
jgi:hypothetical protein